MEGGREGGRRCVLRWLYLGDEVFTVHHYMTFGGFLPYLHESPVKTCILSLHTHTHTHARTHIHHHSQNRVEYEKRVRSQAKHYAPRDAH